MKKRELKKLINQVINEQLASGEVLPNVSQAGSGYVVISCPEGYHFKSDFHDILGGGPSASPDYLIHRVEPCEPDKTITKFPLKR
tara:strand:+ start:286 stop:540 length:255 start_codon:yes stop_codon:yes gene_type:complete